MTDPFLILREELFLGYDEKVLRLMASDTLVHDTSGKQNLLESTVRSSCPVIMLAKLLLELTRTSRIAWL